MSDQFVGGQRVRRPSTEEFLAGHEVRLGRLERAPGGGAYVFLDEIEHDSDGGDTMSLVDIDQGFRHLVFEASLATTAVNAGGATLIVSKTGGFSGGAWGWAEIDDTGNVVTGHGSTDDSGANLPGLIPGRDDSEDVAKVYASITAKIPYYSRGDRVKGLLWQEASMIDADDPYAAFGGGITMYHGDDPADNAPITGLDFVLGAPFEFAAGSLISLYGIR